MADFLQPKELLPATDLSPEDLQAIFESIDDNIAFWQVLHNDPVHSQDNGLPVSLAQLSAVSDWLKMSSAPLYRSQGARGAHGFFYRILNLAVKIFGSPQIHFNQKLREFLGELLLNFQEFNTEAVTLKLQVEDLSAWIRSLEKENNHYRWEIEKLTKQVAELRADIDRSMDDRRDEKQT